MRFFSSFVGIGLGGGGGEWKTTSTAGFIVVESSGDFKVSGSLTAILLLSWISLERRLRFIRYFLESYAVD